MTGSTRFAQGAAPGTPGGCRGCRSAPPPSRPAPASLGARHVPGRQPALLLPPPFLLLAPLPLRTPPVHRQAALLVRLPWLAVLQLLPPQLLLTLLAAACRRLLQAAAALRHSLLWRSKQWHSLQGGPSGPSWRGPAPERLPRKSAHSSQDAQRLPDENPAAAPPVMQKGVTVSWSF